MADTCSPRWHRTRKLMSFSGLICLSIVFTLFTINLTENRTAKVESDVSSPNNMTGYLRSTIKQLCTFDVFRSFYKHQHHLPWAGHWDMTSDTPRYLLNLCDFQYARYPSDLLGKCLLRANITNIATFGDSNGAYNRRGLIHMIRNVHPETTQPACKLFKIEKYNSNGYTLDKEYYAIDNQTWAQYVKTGTRSCRSCLSKRYMCHVTSGEKSQSITLEHLSGYAIIDTSITVEGAVNITKPDAKYVHDLPQATSAQEFYFKYFLKVHKYPDIIVFTMPFNHAMGPVDKHRDEMIELKAIMDKYIPRTTKVFFIPTFSEFPALYKETLAHNYRTFDRNKQIQRLLDEMYLIMEEDLISDTSNRYGFMDLFHITSSLENLSIDGIHMEQEYYDAVMSIFWELYCNSLELGQF